MCLLKEWEIWGVSEPCGFDINGNEFFRPMPDRIHDLWVDNGGHQSLTSSWEEPGEGAGSVDGFRKLSSTAREIDSDCEKIKLKIKIKNTLCSFCFSIRGVGPAKKNQV